MSKFCFNFLVFTFVMMLCKNVKADPGLSDLAKTKLSEHFTSFGIGCIGENPVNFEDIQALKSMKLPKGDNAYCFFGCVLKKAGMIGTDGKLSPEAVLRVSKDIFKDEDEFKKAVQVFQSCAYVNDVPVKDGSKNCERAKLVLTCLIKTSDDQDLHANVGSVGVVDKTITQTGGIHQIVGRVIRVLLRLACDTVSTEGITGRIIGRLIPGARTASLLCSFIKNS